jgi:hypothetical protein
MNNALELTDHKLSYIEGGGATVGGALATAAAAGVGDVTAASVTAFTAALTGAEVGAYGGPAGVMIGAVVGYCVFEFFY